MFQCNNTPKRGFVCRVGDLCASSVPAPSPQRARALCQIPPRRAHALTPVSSAASEETRRGYVCSRPREPLLLNGLPGLERNQELEAEPPNLAVSVQKYCGLLIGAPARDSRPPASLLLLPPPSVPVSGSFAFPDPMPDLADVANCYYRDVFGCCFTTEQSRVQPGRARSSALVNVRDAASGV